MWAEGPQVSGGWRGTVRQEAGKSGGKEGGREELMSGPRGTLGFSLPWRRAEAPICPQHPPNPHLCRGASAKTVRMRQRTRWGGDSPCSAPSSSSGPFGLVMGPAPGSSQPPASSPRGDCIQRRQHCHRTSPGIPCALASSPTLPAGHLRDSGATGTKPLPGLHWTPRLFHLQPSMQQAFQDRCTKTRRMQEKMWYRMPHT